jgi:hypothetical protein
MGPCRSGAMSMVRRAGEQIGPCPNGGCRRVGRLHPDFGSFGRWVNPRARIVIGHDAIFPI